MDEVKNILHLPLKVLVNIIKYVPDKRQSFNVCKKFYDATCTAAKSDSKVSLHGNSEIRNYFDTMVATKRIFGQFYIKEFDSQKLNMNDIEKMKQIFGKFGDHVTSLHISYLSITETDICYILSSFPNIEGLSIHREYSNQTSVSKVVFNERKESLNLTSLASIRFSSKTLQFDKIFENVHLTEKLKTLSITVADPSICFSFLRKYSSIVDLTITSKNSVSLIPINHLKLKNLSIKFPKSTELLSSIEQQTELDALDLLSDEEYSDLEDSDEYGSENSDDESTSSDESIEASRVGGLLQSASNMSLTKLHLNIDRISNDDFIHFSKLSKLQQLSITSEKLTKTEIFSTVSLPSVTKLFLHFTRDRVPNNVLIRIAKNFPNVNDLHFEGDYFCDAYICFTRNLRSLEKLSIMGTKDYQLDLNHYVSSYGGPYNICTSLKSVTLYFSCPDEDNLHSFVTFIALTASNVECLWIETVSLRIVQSHFTYILRNFKSLKYLQLSYDIFPDENLAPFMESMVNVEEYAKTNEIGIINNLKEFGTHLDFVEIYLSSPVELQDELWEQAFRQQFQSIKINDFTVIMKKDENLSGTKLFV